MKTTRLLFCLALAFLFCQLPSFAKQYSIRLEAHMFELESIIRAHSSYKAKKSDEFHEYLIKRQERFALALEKVKNSNPLFYPFWMIVGFDSEILKETWKGYTPSLFFDSAFLIWGLIGSLTGALSLELMSSLWRRRKNP